MVVGVALIIVVNFVVVGLIKCSVRHGMLVVVEWYWCYFRIMRLLNRVFVAVVIGFILCVNFNILCSYCLGMVYWLFI